MNNQQNIKRVDHLIIGFGKAGKTLAYDLAGTGQSVVLVEQSPKMYGGTCINIGCIPSKKLAFLAKQYFDDKFDPIAPNANQSDQSTPDDFDPVAQAVTQKDQLIGKLNQANYDKLASRATVITGKASFINNHRVRVQTADGDQIFEADHLYINTGADSWQPNIDGADNNPFVYNSTGLLQIQTLPKRLVIVGGGYIGLEFAFIFVEFGSQVSILETHDHFLPREDAQIVAVLLQVMAKKGIEVKLNQTIHKISNQGTHATVQTADADLPADAVLIATGRRAKVADLGLENTDIQLDKKGNIAVNDRLQTHADKVWAMGDVAGSPQFTYISLDDYRIVKSQVLPDQATTKTSTHGRTFPYAVFIDPPLANVGLTEDDARQQGFTVKVATLPASNIPKAKILQQTDGLLKAVVDAKTDKILGVQLLCAEAHEMINFMDLAIRQGLTYQAVRDHIFTHPTMSEALNDLFALIK